MVFTVWNTHWYGTKTVSWSSNNVFQEFGWTCNLTWETANHRGRTFVLKQINKECASELLACLVRAGVLQLKLVPMGICQEQVEESGWEVTCCSLMGHIGSLKAHCHCLLCSWHSAQVHLWMNNYQGALSIHSSHIVQHRCSALFRSGNLTPGQISCYLAMVSQLR